MVEGVEEWNKAFVKLGFSNKTIQAVTPDMRELWPRDYSVWDSRYNTISMSTNVDFAHGLGKWLYQGSLVNNTVVINSNNNTGGGIDVVCVKALRWSIRVLEKSLSAMWY